MKNVKGAALWIIAAACVVLTVKFAWWTMTVMAKEYYSGNQELVIFSVLMTAILVTVCSKKG